MSFEKASRFISDAGFSDRILTFDVSSATVALAAEAVGTEPEKIAKSLTFMTNDGPIMIVCAGDAKISNPKYKAAFSRKAVMLKYEEVSQLIGHDVGGVCPFGINDGVRVFFDESLKRFEYIYPACGDSQSAVKLTCDELSEICPDAVWGDFCTYAAAE